MSTVVLEKPERAVAKTMAMPLSIFDEMDRLAREIEERAFHFFQERGAVNGFDLEDWFRAEAELVRPVPIEIEERETEIIVRAEVPGFEAKDLSVTVEPYSVGVYGKAEKRGEHQKKDEATKSALHHYTEISASEVLRQISLPVAINPDKGTAHLSKGVLEIRLPKAAPPKLIEVKSGS